MFKKFTTYQSLKKTAFDPLTADLYPPEVCGYGVRNIKLNRNLDKIEIRNGMKSTVELIVAVDTILRPIVPQITMDILKLQKKMTDPQLAHILALACEKQVGINSNLLLQRPLNSHPHIDKYLTCTYYPFSVILDKGGRLEFIAPSYVVFKEWINGLNLLMRNKKFFNKLKHKIETYYI